MKRLSVTALSTYLSCPRRYRYAYIDFLPLDETLRRRKYALSSIVHNALADFHAARSSEWKDLDAALISNWDNGAFISLQESGIQYHRARWHLWESFSAIIASQPLRFAYPFDISFGGGAFRGRIDRIDELDGSLIVTDYSISSTARDDAEWRLRIYGAVASKVLDRPVSAVRTLELFSGGAFEVFDPGDLEEVETRVEALRRAVSADSTFRPEVDDHCGWCPYLEICEGPRRLPPNTSPVSTISEIFELYRAIERLLAGGCEPESVYSSMLEAARIIDPLAELHALENRELDSELAVIVANNREVEGSLVIDGGILSLCAGSQLISPIGNHFLLLVSSGETRRTTAEILVRNLRLFYDRALEFQRATTDGLTRLKRREVFENDFTGIAARFSLIICDIDHFKEINDSYGHDVGDAALRAFSGLLLSQVGATAYRFGGEEFALLVPQHDGAYLEAFAESIRAAVAMMQVPAGDAVVSFTASFGVAPFRESEPRDDHLRRADKALYEAKNGGRNRCVLAN